jgi:sigma-E factor negative regulatory protein RseB
MLLGRFASPWLLALFFVPVLHAPVAQADEGLKLLERAVTATERLNYSGTYVFHRGEGVEVLRVQHRVDAGGDREKVEVLDAGREFLRVNGEVFCYLHDGNVVKLDKQSVKRFFPALLPEEPGKLQMFYSMQLGGRERVAGRDCRVVNLQPRDKYRYAYTFWLDRATGLPIKARVTNESGAQVALYVFSEVQIGRQPEARQFRIKPPTRKLPALTVSQDSDWSMSAPPGYQRTLQVKRHLPGKAEPVIHSLYSDGLSTLSLFIEPINTPDNDLQGLSTEGAINVYARRVGNYKITTLGEVPAAALIMTGDSVVRQ